MIANIMFFIIWTAVIFIIANRRVKELLDILRKQEERYDDCVSKLKLRSEQNDKLMEVIDELNKRLQDVRQN